MLRPLDSRRCPVDQALEMLAGKWKPMIVWRLSGGPLRHAELRRMMPQVSQRMLTLHLRELERDGLVERRIYAEVPVRVEYELTEPARALLPMLDGLGEWLLAQHGALAQKSRKIAGRSGGLGCT
jgi:DNA-binding HxlR family transcriptional regulator